MRSSVLELTRDQLVQQLVITWHSLQVDGDKCHAFLSDYVLVLMEKPEPDPAFSPDDHGEYSFSIAPIMTTERFIALRYTEDQVSEQFTELDKLADQNLQEQYA
ncbi:MAG: hypothetical protein [Microviridae sp.]|nr:MAG: hypothetical protein [Microviridae sp.]